MITVHHLNDSRSQRILWMLEELGVDYRIERYRRDAKTNLAPPTLEQVHPLGKSPVIEDGGLRIAESGAIVGYLAATYGGGRFLPDRATPDHIAHSQWLHFAEGSAMLPFLLVLYVSRLGEAGAPLHPRIDSEIANHLNYLNGALEGQDFILGPDLMAADFLLIFIAEVAHVQRRLDGYGALKAYMDRIHARPAYARSLEKGGPYRFAPD